MTKESVKTVLKKIFTYDNLSIFFAFAIITVFALILVNQFVLNNSNSRSFNNYYGTDCRVMNISSKSDTFVLDPEKIDGNFSLSRPSGTIMIKDYSLDSVRLFYGKGDYPVPPITEGSFFSDEQLLSDEKLCVVGKIAADRNCTEENGVKYYNYNGYSYRVIGICGEKRASDLDICVFLNWGGYYATASDYAGSFMIDGISTSDIDNAFFSFVEMMNERAAELGCTVTHFEDPNGLSNNNQTTAYEMFLITKEAISHDYFMVVCNIADVTIPATNTHEEREYHNSNSLISPQSVYGGNRYLYSGAAGVKTGYTRAAGYCLISTAEREGLRFLAVVMGCDGWLNAHIEDYLNFEDTIKLYDWGFSDFSYRNVVDTSTPVYEMDVELAEDNAKAVLYPEQNIRLLLPRDITDEDIKLDFNLTETELQAPVKAGEILGEAVVSVNGEVYGTVNLITRQEVDLARSEYLKRQIQTFFTNRWVIGITTMVLLFAAIYITLQIRYRKAREKYMEERREAELRRRERQKKLEEKRRDGWDL